MKILNVAMLLLALTVCAPGQASAASLLGSDLLNLSIFSNTYTSTGDAAKVYGNVLSGTYATTGANSSVFGNLQSGDVGTTGANATVQGNFQSVLAGTIGANAIVAGNFQAGGVGTTGAYSTVQGNFESGLAGTTGAYSNIVGNFDVGGVRALGGGSSVGGTSGATNQTAMSAMTVALQSSLTTAKSQLDAAKVNLNAMGSGTSLAATMTVNTTFDAGVYSAASFSTTAGTTLYLDGQNKANQTWVFNITDILATGASSHVELINAGANSQVLWNTGGYASLGADSSFIGSVLATTYISVGANAVLSNLGGSACGGLFSSTSYVSIGAGAQVGSGGCSAFGGGPIAAVPEPESYALLLAGLGLMGAIIGRRRSKDGA